MKNDIMNVSGILAFNGGGEARLAAWIKTVRLTLTHATLWLRKKKPKVSLSLVFDAFAPILASFLLYI